MHGGSAISRQWFQCAGTTRISIDVIAVLALNRDRCGLRFSFIELLSFMFASRFVDASASYLSYQLDRVGGLWF